MLANTQLLSDSLLIEIDYKQKIIIGMSPRQTSGEYYKQQQRNFLGMNEVIIICFNTNNFLELKSILRKY